MGQGRGEGDRDSPALRGIECLLDTTCTGVSENHPGNFTFEFGAGALSVDCLWRVIIEGRLRLTSEYHGQQYGLPAPLNAYAEAESLLRGRRVTGLRLREGTADVFLDFEGDIQLEVINSSGYEPWSFTAPGIYLVGLGDGGLADCSSTDPLC